MTRDDDGYVALFRRVYSNPAFRDWDEASVFIAIFAHARWRDGTVSTPHGPVALKRGECLISERDLAAHFLMHLNKVRRVLRSLVDHGMVALDPGSNGSRLGTRITVLNYEQYQGRGRRGGDAAERCGSGAGAQRERNEGIAPRNQRRRPPESREEREERESNQKASPSGPPELPSDLRAWCGETVLRSSQQSRDCVRSPLVRYWAGCSRRRGMTTSACGACCWMGSPSIR